MVHWQWCRLAVRRSGRQACLVLSQLPIRPKTNLLKSCVKNVLGMKEKWLCRGILHTCGQDYTHFIYFDAHQSKRRRLKPAGSCLRAHLLHTSPPPKTHTFKRMAAHPRPDDVGYEGDRSQQVVALQHTEPAIAIQHVARVVLLPVSHGPGEHELCVCGCVWVYVCVSVGGQGAVSSHLRSMIKIDASSAIMPQARTHPAACTRPQPHTILPSARCKPAVLPSCLMMMHAHIVHTLFHTHTHARARAHTHTPVLTRNCKPADVPSQGLARAVCTTGMEAECGSLFCGSGMPLLCSSPLCMRGFRNTAAGAQDTVKLCTLSACIHT